MDSIHLIPYIDDAKLYDYAVSCAQTLRPDAQIDGRAEALALRRRQRETERCHALLRRRWGDSSEVPAACEWLLDNRYLLQRETPEVLRALSMAERLLEEADIPGAILSRDPTGDYARTDAVTRDEYRRRLAKLARRRGVEEQVLAEALIKQATREGRHVGFLLFSPPPKRRAACYLTALGLGTLALLFLLTKDLEAPGAALLLLIPVYTLVKGALDFVLLRLLHPRPLPRLELRDGVPPEGKTLCVLSVLLGCCDPSRPTTSRPRRPSARRTARARPTSGCISPVWPPSGRRAFSRGGRRRRGSAPRWRRSSGWSAAPAISTTGTTRARSSRFARR